MPILDKDQVIEIVKQVLRDEYGMSPKAGATQPVSPPSGRLIDLPIEEQVLRDEAAAPAMAEAMQPVSPPSRNNELPDVKQALRAAYEARKAEETESIFPPSRRNNAEKIIHVQTERRGTWQETTELMDKMNRMLRDESSVPPQAEATQPVSPPSGRLIDLPIEEQVLRDEAAAPAMAEAMQPVSPPSRNNELPDVKQALRAAYEARKAEETESIFPPSRRNNAEKIIHVQTERRGTWQETTEMMDKVNRILRDESAVPPQAEATQPVSPDPRKKNWLNE